MTTTVAVDPDIRAAFFDIDGTLTTGKEAWGALVKSEDVNRFRKVWLYSTGLPHYLLSRTGLINQASFRDRWVHLMAWLMTGWTYDKVQKICTKSVHDYLIPVLRPDVVDILKKHKAQGHTIILVSTMFEEIVNGLAGYLGADVGLGSRVMIADGHCTGRINGPSCSGARKVDFIRAYFEQHNREVSFDSCAAYADSHSDVPLLASVGHPVAIYPDETMRSEALKRGWAIYP
jgi:HAD superfamily hydrolase (TIGR01490 family)